MLQCLRDITKHNIYAMSRTFIQNGLSSNTAIVSIVPWWETTLLAISAVSGVGFVLCAVLTAVWTLGGKKRSDEKEG